MMLILCWQAQLFAGALSQPSITGGVEIGSAVSQASNTVLPLTCSPSIPYTHKLRAGAFVVAAHPAPIGDRARPSPQDAFHAELFTQRASSRQPNCANRGRKAS